MDSCRIFQLWRIDVGYPSRSVNTTSIATAEITTAKPQLSRTRILSSRIKQNRLSKQVPEHPFCATIMAHRQLSASSLSCATDFCSTNYSDRTMNFTISKHV